VGATGLKIWAEIVAWGTWIVKPAGAKAGVPFSVGINASPALLSVGYIVGFNVAVVIFAGAVLNRWVAMPLFGAFGDPASIIVDQVKHISLLQALNDPDNGFFDHVDLLHAKVTRYLGVGGMLVGGLWSLFKLRKSLIGGVKAGLDAYKHGRSGGTALPRTERDMPMNIILILIAASVIPLFFLFHSFDVSFGVSAVMAIVMVIAGFLFSAVASYMAGLVGSSNNPVSGITVSTILVSALLLLGMGVGGKAGPISAILIGGVVCCAAAIGGDNLQDLKCGQLVGSTPWKQQVMQLVGVVVAALVMAPILNLLNDGYTIGSKAISAPQANLMGTVARGVFAGGLPWLFIGIGAAIAVVVIVIDLVLEHRNAKFRIPVMAFAVGIYLPFDLNVPIFLGGCVALVVSRYLDRTKASPERRSEVERMGLLAAAGFITGEALLGIALAVPIAASGNKDAITVAGGKYSTLMWPGVLLVVGSLILLYKLALRPQGKKKGARRG
jgi:putative OPT family oligopeptide transporter